MKLVEAAFLLNTTLKLVNSEAMLGKSGSEKNDYLIQDLNQNSVYKINKYG